MDEIAKLRKQAAKARRFAASITDEPARAALEQYARECDVRIETLQDRAREAPVDNGDASTRH